MLKIDDKMVNEMESAARSGLKKRQIMIRLDIGSSAFYRYMKEGDQYQDMDPDEIEELPDYERLCTQFVKAYHRGRTAWKLEHLTHICEDKDWRARAWALERSDPFEYGKKEVFEEESLNKWLKNFSTDRRNKILKLMEEEIDEQA